MEADAQTTPGYPFMIELFSRAPEGFDLGEDSCLTPLPIDETIASLSAILLDEAYYGLLKANLRDVAGLPLLHEAALIPFKARAYLDLSQRKADGERPVGFLRGDTVGGARQGVYEAAGRFRGRGG